MTMHLEGPWLSTTGKKKGKRKFRTAEAAKRARELNASWKDLLKKYEVETSARKKNRALSAEPYIAPKPSYRGANDPKIPSLITTWDPCTKPPDKVYTGNKIIGIGTMHKSNAIPVFSDEQARDISKMRR